jgi:hypothetical protein
MARRPLASGDVPAELIRWVCAPWPRIQLGDQAIGREGIAASPAAGCCREINVARRRSTLRQASVQFLTEPRNYGQSSCSCIPAGGTPLPDGGVRVGFSLFLR